jgi:predicted RNase H-like HicB family nuclease
MPKTLAAAGFSLAIEYYREVGGRWLADIAALPGVTAYGRGKKQATAAVQALAPRLIAGRLEHGEALPGPMPGATRRTPRLPAQLAGCQPAAGYQPAPQNRLMPRFP